MKLENLFALFAFKGSFALANTNCFNDLQMAKYIWR